MKSPNRPPGTVISQTPAAGTQLKVGGQVTIVVAQALKQAAVPSLVGQSEAQAVATLTSAGFTSHTVQRTVTDPTKVGIVVQQSPKRATSCAKGGEVTIAVGVLAQQTTSTSTTTTLPPPRPPRPRRRGGAAAAGSRSVPAPPVPRLAACAVSQAPLLEQRDLRDLRRFASSAEA